jgi:hypothetical protein
MSHFQYFLKFLFLLLILNEIPFSLQEDMQG